MKVVGFIICGFGALITLVNFYSSYVSYPLHRLISKDKPFTYSSPVPIVGSLLLWLGAIWLRSAGSVGWRWLLVLSLLDTGGIHWFLLLMVLAVFFRWRR
ncbi:MAG: hypothetical protein QOC99_632 [Acidobacteriota bacterium]|jgi:hypothetical protein|nr:hypothetical protein [Acidobacteriota bacterium]